MYTTSRRISHVPSVVFALAAISGVQTAAAQVVRGRVTEVVSSAPVGGALVSLVGESGDSSLITILTTASGEYALRAGVAGQFRLSVKRIGVRRFVSPVFELRDGETRVVDVQLDPIAQTLPQVTVSALCVNRSSEHSRIASLWDEARTALEATKLSQRDRLIQTRLTRYVADLDPVNLQVLSERHLEAELLIDQPFKSASGEVLSALGYWLELANDSVEYLAPDADALSSNAFLRDHCFALTYSRVDHPGMIGLAFSPVRGRPVPDIAGTIWIDSTRFELRSVDFRYSRLPDKFHRLWCQCAFPLPIRTVGGEVHFSRLASGAWIVDRWFLRLPVIITERNQTGNSGILGGFSGTRRQLTEAGGSVSAEGMTAPTGVTVTGVVRDSSGQPMADALIRAVGTNGTVRTAADGTYRLDGLPSGGFSVVVRTAPMDSLGLLAAARRVRPDSTSLRVDFRMPNTAALRSASCPMHNVPSRFRPVGRGVLRVLLVDSVTAEPLTGVRLTASWPGRTDRPPYLLTREAVTDSRGAASFCDLAIRIPIELAMRGSDGLDVHLMTFEASRTGLVTKVIHAVPIRQ